MIVSLFKRALLSIKSLYIFYNKQIHSTAAVPRGIVLCSFVPVKMTHSLGMDSGAKCQNREPHATV